MQKKYTKFEMEVTDLSPEKAIQLLEGQVDKQRNLAKHHVKRYTDALSRGMWLFDGTPIKIDWYGRMIDGQHRCNAVIQSGKTIKKIVMMYGLDPDVFKVLDSGKTRSLGDVLKINNEAHYNCTASSVSLAMKYFGDHAMQNSNIRLQTEDVLKFIDEHPDIRESVKKGMKAKHILPTGICGFLHYIFSLKHLDEADIFFDKLASGEGFIEKDPVRVLRDRLLFSKSEKARMTRLYQMAISIKAWNLCRNGKKCRSLSWRNTSNPFEEFPVAI